MTPDEGYSVYHRLRNYSGENRFQVTTEFINNTGDSVMLEMIISASLDNLCMFDEDDGSKDLVFHTFRDGEPTEGKAYIVVAFKVNMVKS